ncbi:hypothetical protein HZS_5561 [Henneguya salminicola]|nr:hypothetical protein HZS_5561 [Henneguya salminicola]
MPKNIQNEQFEYGQSPRTPLSVRQQTKLVEKLEKNESYQQNIKTTPIYKRNVKGETALHRAAIRGDIKRMEEIIYEYPIVDIFDHAGWTPLLEASNRGKYAAVLYLIDHGADINFRGPNNVTPLHDACYNNRIDVIKLLISKNADLDAKDDNGVSPRDYIKTNLSVLHDLIQQTKNLEENLISVCPSPILSPFKFDTKLISFNDENISPKNLTKEQKEITTNKLTKKSSSREEITLIDCVNQNIYIKGFTGSNFIIVLERNIVSSREKYIRRFQELVKRRNSMNNESFISILIDITTISIIEFRKKYNEISSYYQDQRGYPFSSINQYI